MKPKIDMKPLRTIVATIGLLTCSVSAASSASLLGDTVNCSTSGTSTWICVNNTAVVGSGDEFIVGITGNTDIIVDIGASDIRLDMTTGIGNMFGLGPLTFGSLDFGTGIAGLSYTSNVTGLSSDRFSFTPDSVSINLDFLNSFDGGFVEVELFETTVVPLPAAFPMLLAALGGLGLMARRKRRVG
ncbi:VPLPA-CTERM sorting domain-containing protein [Marimonas sp. MJW-29]|uniref:VPLPA-CTERM sorting domain-containing protein n=1 Tax=Sulfitobacter sediminis TaxID=3234186 RepID=A0ABV3RND5_9RHOB